MTSTRARTHRPSLMFKMDWKSGLTEIPLGSAAIGSQWVQPFRHGDPIKILD
eukprot:COSAG01_NODE_1553_length_9931_cov_3.092657_9_plen_52_part_00